jgi:peptidoglycan/LPS O-acetylase OafA/YrhL
MVAVTCVAGWFLLLPEDLAKLGASVIAQSLLVSNFYFWRTTNYFGGANEEKPLLHTWSLAVEEQFYLIFPIALMAIWAFFNYRLKKRDERNLTTEDTECTEVKAGARLAGQAGAAFSNPSASQLARDSENTSLIRSADTPSSLPATSYPPPVTSPVGDNRRWALFWIFGAVAVVSFGISIWGVKAQPFATFFLLPTRAWELLVGSMLAVLPATVVIRSAALRELLCVVGLAGIFGPVFFYGEQTLFPGLAALPPCLGTAVLIFANTVPVGTMKQGYFAKALSWRPMVFIGLISYSLYLWHWPVICFSSYWAVSDFTLFEKLGLVALSIILALISWKFIETPFRKGRKIFTRPRIFTLAGVSTALVFAGGLAFQVSGGFPLRLPDSVVSVLDDLREDEAMRRKFADMAPNITDYSQEHLKSLPRIGVQDPRIAISFVVLGDSHAQVAMGMFDALAKKHNRAGVAITHQGTPPLLGWNITQRDGSKNPEALWDAAFDYIKTNKITDVFLMGYWSSYDQNEIKQRSVETLERFSQSGMNAWILMGAPSYSQNVARMNLRNMFFGVHHKQNGFHLSQVKLNTNRDMFLGLQEQFRNHLVDAAENFSDPAYEKYPVALNNKLLYFDSNHLTHFGNNTAYAMELEHISFNKKYHE